LALSGRVLARQSRATIYFIVWNMRFAHIPHNKINSGERRRREQAIVMESRQTLKAQ